MFGIDAAELVLLIVLFIIMFGPERMPQLARKAAHAFVSVRDMATKAQTQLRSELGPEYSDLELKDLNPKSFVKKHMSAEIAAIDEARRELSNARTSVQDSLKLAATETEEAATVARRGSTAVEAGPAPELPELELPRFDVEAT